MDSTRRSARLHEAHVRIARLGDPESEDLLATTTVAERLEMVAVLARRMWELTGRPFPAYARDEIPARIVRLKDLTDLEVLGE